MVHVDRCKWFQGRSVGHDGSQGVEQSDCGCNDSSDSDGSSVQINLSILSILFNYPTYLTRVAHVVLHPKIRGGEVLSIDCYLSGDVVVGSQVSYLMWMMMRMIVTIRMIISYYRPVIVCVWCV